MKITLLDCNLYYHETLQPNCTGMPVLLLHGWGCDGKVFSSLEKTLMENASRIVIVDFPGHGQSEEPNQAWDIAMFSKQILALLESLSINKINVVAHSFGGRVAIYIAGKHKNIINKLVITGGAGIKKPLTIQQQKKQKRYKLMQGCLNNIKKVSFLKPFIEKCQKNLQNKYGSADYNALNENMKKTFVNIVSEDLSPLLSEICTPTLLIWGTNDTETPLWMGKQMETEIKDSALIEFDGRGHFAFIEEPQRFNIIANEFFYGGKI